MSVKADQRYSDAACRASDIVMTHLLADKERALRSWVAIRLSDGSSDNILYDRRTDAVRHQLHETQCMYIKVQPGFTPKIAERVLAIHRQVYDAGLRLVSTEEDREVIIPMRLEEVFP